jgi:U3 small nucleolar RNA-associated protein 3
MHMQAHARMPAVYCPGEHGCLQAKKAAKASKKAPRALQPPRPDPEAAEPRAITAEIQKNRGLTPHRRKDTKNPRKHARMKHADKEKRRKGQVQGVKAQAGPYAGEATGIKARVSKSTRLA